MPQDEAMSVDGIRFDLPVDFATRVRNVYEVLRRNAAARLVDEALNPTPVVDDGQIRVLMPSSYEDYAAYLRSLQSAADLGLRPAYEEPEQLPYRFQRSNRNEAHEHAIAVAKCGCAYFSISDARNGAWKTLNRATMPEMIHSMVEVREYERGWIVVERGLCKARYGDNDWYSNREVEIGRQWWPVREAALLEACDIVARRKGLTLKMSTTDFEGKEAPVL